MKPRAFTFFNTIGPFCFLAFFVASGFALDREAFSITNYDLNLQVDPTQHRLGVRGSVVLRNDSSTPQKIAVLQISSSLDWRAIKAGDTAVQFVAQPFASDIDHTGALSEAIVTLPQPVEPHETVNLQIAYEGVIVVDATRLTRIGTPEDQARSSDWDQIGEQFIALRGAGYVAWYPIATESVDLSEADSLAQVLNRWKEREVGSGTQLHISLDRSASEPPQFLYDGVACDKIEWEQAGLAQKVLAECKAQKFRQDVPTLVIADYKLLEKRSVEVRYQVGHESAATEFADAAERAETFVADWFGPARERAKTAELPVANAAPFESGALLLTPLSKPDSALYGLAAAHQLAHASFLSFRPWIEEGLAHFSQSLYLESQKNRQAALDYLGLHRSAFIAAENDAANAASEVQARQSLINTNRDEFYRSKAMYVWWMLRDMLGDAALKKAIATYRPEQDKETSYMPRLIAAQTPRDLEWFFDDWVYRDRGLPEFKVEPAFARKTMTNAYMVTITVDNVGSAGAEVPVKVKFAGGDVTKRLEVRAKQKATIRVEVPGVPSEIVVNDGSVPEANLTNNVYKVTVSE